MIVFYAVRFLAPVVGVLLIAIQGVERGQLLVGIGSAIIAAGVIVGLLLLNGIMWVLTDRLGWYYVWSKVGATVVVYTWNFFARRAMYGRDVSR